MKFRAFGVLALVAVVAAWGDTRQSESCADGTYHQVGTCPADLEPLAATDVLDTTATARYSIDRADGTTENCIVQTGSEKADCAAVKTCSGAIDPGDDSVVASGARTVSVTGLTASTAYKSQHCNESPSGWDSDMVSSAQFTTQGGGGALLFSDNFDAQPDWHSQSETTDNHQFSTEAASAISPATATAVPDGWYYVYQANDNWHPGNGNSSNHYNMELLAANSSKCRGGTGKCLVWWRESAQSGFESDSFIWFKLPPGSTEFYVEFYIQFQSGWTDDGSSKIFRFSAWENSDALDTLASFFSDGDHGPILIVDYDYGFGIRNKFAPRGGPYGENYFYDNGELSDWPNIGPTSTDNRNANMNFGSHTSGMALDGGDPCLPDQVNGGCLIDYADQNNISHEQVYGTKGGGTWTKIAFYAKLNSALDATDGILMEWVNDVLIFNKKNVPWVQSNTRSLMPSGFDLVGFGGNDNWGTYAASSKVEEWYAIDDISIYSESQMATE